MLGRQMVSLKDSLDAVERRETLLETALAGLTGALIETENHILDAWADRPRENKGQLRAYAGQIKSLPSVDLLSGAREHFQQEVRACGEWMKASLAGSLDLQEILQVLAETAEQIRDNGDRHEGRFRTLAQDLDGVSRLNSIHELRAGISKEVQRLVAWVDEAKRERDQMLSRLDQELTQCRHKLVVAVTEASVDPLTGLGNRREMERHAGELIAEEKAFCIILVDVDRFKYINDKHGHVTGDEVLVALAGRLKGQMRATDFACRWGGDEFLILLACSLRDGMLRAQQLQNTLCGKYALGRAERPLRLDVTVSVGVSERRQGELLEQVVERADVQMYRQKTLR